MNQHLPAGIAVVRPNLRRFSRMLPTASRLHPTASFDSDIAKTPVDHVHDLIVAPLSKMGRHLDNKVHKTVLLKE